MPDPQTPPASSQETPASGTGEDKGDAPNESGDEMVTLSKKEHADLLGLKTRQSELTQREQAVKEREEALKGKGKGNKSKPRTSSSKPQFSFEEPEEVTVPTMDENERESAKLQTGVGNLLIDNPEYLEIVNSDPTLKKILKRDATALLDDIPIDAEDALSQVEDILKSRLEDQKQKTEERGKKGKNKEEVEGTDTEAETAPPPTTPPADTKKQDKQQKTFGDVEAGLASRIGEGFPKS